ncbi:MAG: hypothetical protein ACLSDJ_06280, partial [Butyricimonas faecihominis]
RPHRDGPNNGRYSKTKGSARAIVTDKFNTFTLEQELNMDETLREFFNDVYEILTTNILNFR